MSVYYMTKFHPIDPLKALIEAEHAADEAAYRYSETYDADEGTFSCSDEAYRLLDLQEHPFNG